MAIPMTTSKYWIFPGEAKGKVKSLAAIKKEAAKITKTALFKFLAKNKRFSRFIKHSIQ